MICNYVSSSPEIEGKSIVQQDFKPFHMILEDYLNGNVAIPQTDSGSFQFAQESDVDFKAEGLDHRHDIFNVAAGVDPVFPDAKAVDTAPAPAPSAPDPSNSPDVSE